MSQKAEKATGGQRAAAVIGELAFIIGIVLAIIAGVAAPGNGLAILALVVLGIIVSVLNITAREVVTVLVASIALISVGSISGIPGGAFGPLDALTKPVLVGTWLNAMVAYLAVFMVPVAVISAVRAVWAVGRPG